jgi:hypothetical protein
MVRIDDTLYVSTYEVNSSEITGARIIAANLVSGTQSMLIPGTRSYILGTGAGWAYAAETDVATGSIWRFKPGTSPVELVAARPYMRAVIADDSYVYWAERPSATDVIVRRAIAGGPIEAVMECAQAWTLEIDTQNVYCANFDHNVFRAPKTGPSGVSIAYSTYPISGMIRCGSDLFITNMGEPKVDRVPTPDGPKAPFAAVPEVGRFLGIVATANDFYVSAFGMSLGVYRFERSTAQYQLLVPGDSAEFSPVTWNGELLYLARDLGVRRCVD